MSVTFFGGEVDDEARDEIYWMELHGFKIDYVQKRNHTEYYFSLPQRCNALHEIQTAGGATNYVCGVYEARPQMCRDYDGSMDTPFGVADCLWRLEKKDKPLPETTLVQLETSSR
jgi:hypothetical protein